MCAVTRRKLAQPRATRGNDVAGAAPDATHGESGAQSSAGAPVTAQTRSPAEPISTGPPSDETDNTDDQHSLSSEMDENEAHDAQVR